MSICDPPIFDKYGTESVVNYMKRVKKYNDVDIKREKYKMLLDFINKWLNYNKKYQLKSLREFRNIRESTLLYNLKHNRNMLRKYGTQIKEKLKFRFHIDDDTDSDDIKDRYILYFTIRALNSIGYTLQCTEIEHRNNTKNKKKQILLVNYYTIKEKKRKPRRKKNDEKLKEMKKIADSIKNDLIEDD